MRFTCEPESPNPRSGDEKAPLFNRNLAKNVPRQAEMFPMESCFDVFTIASETADMFTGSSSAFELFADTTVCDCYMLLLERRGRRVVRT